MMNFGYFENKRTGRSMYAYYPDGPKRTAHELSFITVLREDASEESAKAILSSEKLKELAEYHRMIICMPNPLEHGWNSSLDPKLPNDVEDLKWISREFMRPQGPFDRDTFHPMHYARYYMGIGEGASMVNTLVALDTTDIAGIATVGGEFKREAALKACPAVTPALILNGDEKAEKYFVASCKAFLNSDENGVRTYRCEYNPAQYVIAKDGDYNAINEEVFEMAWNELFSKVRRPNTSVYGDIYPRDVRGVIDYEEHIDDTCLGDNNGMEHTWFTYVPKAVKENPDKKVPLVVFGHGGSDNPAEAANMSCLYKLADEKNFVVVFPWSGEKYGWNINMSASMPDDIAYIYALIEYTKKTHPIDETRVYASGFSMGSAMLQVFSMVHPEVIAAMFPNNTRWCQEREVPPFTYAAVKKAAYDYRMPSWYTYGGRDMEQPVFRGNGQQVQYDFWKNYNNIPVKTTPYADKADPSLVGVPGDIIEEIYPDKTHPNHRYTAHKFISLDEGNPILYNYILMHTKGHDCAPEDARLGYAFASKFRRNKDGSLSLVEE